MKEGTATPVPMVKLKQISNLAYRAEFFAGDLPETTIAHLPKKQVFGKYSDHPYSFYVADWLIRKKGLPVVKDAPKKTVKIP